jgi:predicted transcriptional regulator
MKLTPLKVEMLLHIKSQMPIPNLNYTAQQAVISEFLSNGLIEFTFDNNYCLAQKGKKFVGMILDTPLPVLGNHWVDPRTLESKL